MSDDPQIVERKNGPLLVKHLDRMQHRDGTAIATKPVMALCRCGHSRTKPFCDNSHQRVGFEDRGGKPEGPDRVFRYDGAEVAVTFNPRLCAHAAECGRIAPAVFDPNQKPWVQPDRGRVAEIEAVVAACPSGALKIATGDGAGEDLIGDDAPSITVQKNGPYWVRNMPPPVPPEGAGMTPRKYVLCRCGMSGAKPFCDGSHRDKGWSDSD
jgi:CDGSH-type Zn-finger protein/ferredoxin